MLLVSTIPQATYLNGYGTVIIVIMLAHLLMVRFGKGAIVIIGVVRGGAYRSPASSMRVENREKFKSGKGQYNVGIRIARDL